MVLTTLLSPAVVAQLKQAFQPMRYLRLSLKIANQFVGILVGIVSAEIYNRFHEVELPKALAFFSGKRLVPILTSIAGIAMACILLVVWPVIYDALIAFGTQLQSMGACGCRPVRLLQPFDADHRYAPRLVPCVLV